MQEFKPGQLYRFKNKRSGLYMSIAGYSNSEYAKCEQWFPQDGGARDYQLWHVFPLDTGSCLVINKGSALCLGVDGNSDRESTYIVQRPLLTPEEFASEPDAHRRNEANRLWSFQEDARNKGFFRISNNGSGRYLNIESKSASHSAKCEQWVFEDDDSQLWALELESEDSRVSTLRVDGGDIGDIKRLNSYSQPEPGVTTPVLLGRMALPFFLVKDGPLREQARVNTYYILSRSSYWERIGTEDLAGSVDTTKEHTYTVGVTTTQEKEIEERSSISITASAGIEFEGVSASVGTTITRELNIRTSYRWEGRIEDQWKVVRDFKKDDKRRIFADWIRVERYSLTRMDGTPVVSDVNVQIRSDTKQDSYTAPVVLKSGLPPPVTAPAVPAGLALVSPGGWRVEGLSVESAAELLGRLRC